MPSVPPSPRVLIVKLGALGDTVMASAMLGALRERWPGAAVTWVTAEGLAPLVRRFEGVDRVIAVDADALLAGRGLRRARAAAQALWRIGRGPYDLALVAHADLRYDRLLLGVRASERRALRAAYAPQAGEWHGAAYGRLAQGDAAPVVTTPDDVAARDAAPVAATLEDVAARDAAPGAVAPRDVAPRLATLRWPQGGAPRRAGARHVLLAPGGARNVLRDDALRRWPLASWVSLAQALAAEGCRLTVVGGAGDRVETAAVCAAVPAAEDATGRDTLEALVARIAAADAVVTHDSGVSHLAQLVRTPAVVLFGPTPPAHFVAPGAAVTVRSAAAGLACAPCYDGRDYAPCADNRCLREVGADAVADAVRAYI